MYIAHVDLVKVRNVIIKVRKNEPAEKTELNCVRLVLKFDRDRGSTVSVEFAWAGHVRLCELFSIFFHGTVEKIDFPQIKNLFNNVETNRGNEK